MHNTLCVYIVLLTFPIGFFVEGETFAIVSREN